MFISPRILRRDTQLYDPEKRYPTERDIAQRERILAVGRGLMARHGRAALSMTSFAAALGHGTWIVRRHFADLDALQIAIIEDHLGQIREAFREIPRDLPDRQAALRAAYHRATRAGPGRLSDAHLLLVRDRHLLPEDEQEPIAEALRSLGTCLADDLGPEALTLLDNPLFSPDRVERLLETFRQEAAPAPAAEHRPDPPPVTTPGEPPPEPPRPKLSIQDCLPRGFRPDPPRRPHARAGPNHR